MASTIALRATGAAATLGQRFPSPTGVLAEPPPGSGLKPIRGEYGPPLVGHTFSLLGDPIPFARRRYERFGPVSWFGAFGTRMVSVNGPDAIGEVLTNSERAFSNREGWQYVIGPFFNRGVMLMDFEEHHHHRKIMQQAFRRERLLSYLKKLNPRISAALARWEPGAGFPLYTRSKQLTLDLATEVFVGAELGPEANQLNRAFVAAVRGGATPVRFPVPGLAWDRGLRGRRWLEDYFSAQLPAKRASDGDDLFSVLCHAKSEDGHGFTDDDVVNHMIFVLMAAHDTSTITLSNMGYLLAKHPEWQARLREESQALGKDAIDYDDLERLESMDLVMKEALRLYSPVGVVFRQALKDTSIQGHYVPAGARLGLGLYPSQRMEPWWSDPDRFDPERFAEPRREDRSHKYAWVPFGGGVHKCIGMYFGGMEVKAILHQLLLRFAWTVRPGYELPITYSTGPTPADGLPITLSSIPRTSPSPSRRTPTYS
jgi:cytochrome P450